MAANAANLLPELFHIVMNGGLSLEPNGGTLLGWRLRNNHQVIFKAISIIFDKLLYPLYFSQGILGYKR